MSSEIDTSSGGGIADRLARLKLQQQASNSTSNSRERPTPPARRLHNVEVPLIAPRPQPPKSVHNGNETEPASPLTPEVKKAPPPLPTRRTNSNGMNGSTSTTTTPSTPPPLPRRKTSNASMSSIGSTHSTAPPALPPRLPPRRPTSNEVNGSHQAAPEKHPQSPPKPLRILPPPLSEAPPPPRRLPPPASETSPPLPSRRPRQSTAPPSPPPIPILSSFTPAPPPPVPSTARPSLPVSRPAPPLTPPTISRPTSPSNCLVCRDYSHADSIAAQPHLNRTNITSLEALAFELCSPFPQSTIDKARAIFTWLHHNIVYDIDGLNAGCPFRGSPLETIRAGKAVCQGYAEIFEELCILDGISYEQVKVVSGKGKGAGYKPLKPGDPIPPEKPDGHAWNAIYFPEEGFERWHLIDPCWGAGGVNGGTYKQRFNTTMFTMSPEEFGRRHYPKDPDWQCNNGKIMDWETFIAMEAREGPSFQAYGDLHELGFAGLSVQPHTGVISDDFVASQDGILTFQISKQCPHKPINLSEEYVIIVHIDGVNDVFPLSPPPRTAKPGEWESVIWKTTLDFRNTRALRGVTMDRRKITLCRVTKFDGRDGKGLPFEEWKRKNGRVVQAWGGLGGWNMK